VTGPWTPRSLPGCGACAAVLLTETGRELQVRYGIQDFTMFRKSYFGHPVEESLIQRILHNCDFAVAAIGD
jgi:ATP-dependent protease Clp ATPase subunit